ncbi:MAG: hypothetical protein AB1505_30650 [Candidatus Latescibacterota bacterium]
MSDKTLTGGTHSMSPLLPKLRSALLQGVAAALGVPFGVGVLVIAMTVVAWGANTTLAAVLRLSQEQVQAGSDASVLVYTILFLSSGLTAVVSLTLVSWVRGRLVTDGPDDTVGE